MILVTGSSGQLARELSLLPDMRTVGRSDCDLSVPGAGASAVFDLVPDAVINAAAFTDVDGAEKREEDARRLNADAPGEIAHACAVLNIPFVHVSTDYVFDGSGRHPFSPDAQTGPLGAYGRTKLAGERAVAAAGGNYAILRTSWVFSAHGRNFVRTMRRLGADRGDLRVVGDQHGGPTPARGLAAACRRVAGQLGGGSEKSGIYHYAGAPDTTWADFAREIFRQSGFACKVVPIATGEWPTPARRPLNSRLDCTSFTRTFGLERPDWRAGLQDVLEELGGIPHD